eukprot:6482261-Amphidinium_carterae.3
MPVLAGVTERRAEDKRVTYIYTVILHEEDARRKRLDSNQPRLKFTRLLLIVLCTRKEVKYKTNKTREMARTSVGRITSGDRAMPDTNRGSTSRLIQA